MTPAREWLDKRDNTCWMLWWPARRDRPGLAFSAETGENYGIEVDFQDGLEDRSDAELERLLDEARR